MDQTILVVQGAEYQAVRRGLQKANSLATVIAIPMGIGPVKEFLAAQLQQNRFDAQSQIIVMGLCGSLKPAYQVGDIVLYKSAMNFDENEIKTWQCNLQFTNALHSRLPAQAFLVDAWTSQQFIQSAQTKQHLGQTHQVDVVDMEGTAILEALSTTGAAVSMLRVVSDDCHHVLPDLSSAIDSMGTLQPIPLIKQMIRHPIGALQLIQGAKMGLKVLEQMTAALFSVAKSPQL